MLSVLISLIFVLCTAFANFDPHDGRLNLTPYLNIGKLEEARKASEVDPTLFAGVKSHAAYFTVNKTMGWNTFFWYFPIEEQDENTPLVIWLQGGPGMSSLFGLFTEIGPLMLVNGTVKKMPVTWANYSLLFIDNPVGTGFSYSTQEVLARNQDEIGQSLLNFIQQFLGVFQALRRAPLFIAGEDYAGKYIPTFGHYIHNKDNLINLRGLAISGGWTDPPSLTYLSELGYQHGFVDDLQYNELVLHENRTRKCFSDGDMKCYISEYKILESLWSSYTNVNPDNYLYDILGKKPESPEEFLNRPKIQQAIHVGKMKYQETARDVKDQLEDDYYMSVRPWLEELLEHYGVLGYNGQLDVKTGYALSRHTYENLKWSGQDEYKQTAREPLPSSKGPEIYGYTTDAGNFVDVMVRGAGHYVPTDQPVYAKYMIDRFINKFK